MAIGVVLFGIAVAPGVASAHHPVLSGTTECFTGESWSVAWTAQADEVRGVNWQIVTPSGYAPAGPQADSLPFTRTASYPESQASATEVVSATWSNDNAGSSSATVDRPPRCVVTTTTSTTTTTTQPAVTTTSTAGATTTAATTTVAQTTPTTVVGQEGPTSTVDQSSGAATTTDPVGRTLPATGNGDGSANLIVVALTLIGFGAVMFRFASKPSR